MSLRDRFRQPEYTGKNRCVPCTAVNLLIAVVVSVLTAVVSTVGGFGVFILSIGAIYLRGYLVPGTPTLTKRYFPERVLRWFDKNPTMPVDDATIDVDPEQVLYEASAVEPCREGHDLCLTDEFHNAWRERIASFRQHDLGEEHLAGVLAIPLQKSDIMIDQRGEAFVAHTDTTVIAQWSSRAAVIADVAAVELLSERASDWSDLAPGEIARVLMSLRVFVEECPKCGGPVHVDQEPVESCCRSYDVVTSECQDCEARLFEMEWDEPAVFNR